MTDGEQRESSFATYPITDTLAGTGLADNLAGDGQFFAIFDDGHHRQLPRLTGGPFRYKTFASEFVEKNRAIATHAGQAGGDRAVDADAAVSAGGRDRGLLARAVPRRPLRRGREGHPPGCFDAGAVRVSIDFTEGRLANKNDCRNPWTNKDMLQEFIDLNNRVIDRFSAEERVNIGIHTCPGGDCDSVHSKEVPYEKLLSKMFQLNAGYFLIQCASEEDRESVYRMCGEYSREDANGVAQVCFMGVINPLDPRSRRPSTSATSCCRGQVHPGRAAGRDRRLRLLAVLARRQAQARLAGLRARHRDAEDRGAAGGRRAGAPGARRDRLTQRAGRARRATRPARFR